MDKDTFEKLISDLTVTEQLKGRALWNGVVSGITEYQNKKTAANLNNWKAAEKALDEFINAATSTPVNEKTFKGIPAVVKYLHDQGWKISDRTAYNHKEKHLLLPRKDGKYYQTDVDRYAAGGNLQRLDGSTAGDTDNLSEEKQREELNKVKSQNALLDIKVKAAQGLYVPKDKFERELAHRAMIFKIDVEDFCRKQAGAIINLVGGDRERVPDLIEYMLAVAAGWLSRYAADREFTVPVPAPTAESILQDPDDDEGMEDLEE